MRGLNVDGVGSREGKAMMPDLGVVEEETEGDAREVGVGGWGFEAFPTLLTRFSIDVLAFNNWSW